MLGSIQSGRRSSLRLLQVTRHEDVIVDARAAALRPSSIPIPSLSGYPALADAVARLRRDEHSEFLEKA